ncbi:MAG: SsrA-binding protein SmpB [Candidatus Auribacter fodinae]|jgi:SsrA-binding protein|uniref:SsrA-binding protein n=1 Tax=Candidatus Auribacter fodinae TaxID=2093366 RepID=A0A3A4R8X0_9BACT|nr:MAG: SsrA-binding protein SmpB [Candidatus Auribacter fodinae]
MAKKDTTPQTPRVTNRKARRDYELLETIEAGIMLSGTEVKSLRNGKGNLNDSYAMVEKGELFLLNFHISTYEQGNRFNHDPVRTRKLLLHKNEILRLTIQVQEKGLTLVPTAVYFNKRGIVKVEVAVGRGKHLYDKREDIKRRTQEREVRRELGNRGLGRFAG